ncbi:C6 zinc finger domain-containing protein [Stagonosporopsis vannaccii]|nr:C6 zinc finger domain-containing protein [Stagonosporopsis vannaccii]
MESKCPSYLGNKRPLKGLKRACWECKKRKIHGSSSQTDISIYSSMSTPTGTDRMVQQTTCQMHMGERLGKLEQLFERFVCRKNASVVTSEAPRSPTLVDFSDTQSKDSAPMFSSDVQSVSSLGEGILGVPTWKSAPAIRTLPSKPESTQPPSCDAVHKVLTALLPSQHDADIIFESSNGWMILDGIYSASKEIYVNRDHQSYALDMSAVAQERAVIVARTLLHLAVCINSLPPEFDPSCLTGIWSLDATMQNYVSTVNSLVTDSDEHMLTLHGLECLMLLAVYHLNSANLRQAWLVVRRAMNLAHLMGFHRIVVQADLDPPIPAVSSAKSLWRRFVDFDRYLGLHLRLPFGADDVPFSDDSALQIIHRARINALSKEVADLDRDITPQSYAKALALDEKLEVNMRQMPPDFWDVPNIPPTARSPESFAALERLMVQMWHFEMKIFIHLPYLLRAPQESRYEFSKVTALQASRNVLMRWFALRNASITQACCRLGEIGVFIAAVTLTLDIVIELAMKEKSEVQKTKGTDFAMICRLIGEMEKLAKASAREKIAARSAVVLKKMLCSLDPNKQASGKARLTIPFFGKMDLEYRKLPVRPVFDLDSDTGKKMNATGHHLPVFSFVSNALWPPMSEGYERDLDWDIVLFDGLEDRDTEGNWVF